MKLSKARVAEVIDRVASVKQDIASLEASIAGDLELLKKYDGYEGSELRVAVVAMPRRTMTVKAHKQLRLHERHGGAAGGAVPADPRAA
jgi:hypothetical protein